METTLTFTPVNLQTEEEMDFDTYLRLYMDKSADLLDGKVYQEVGISENHDKLVRFLTTLFAAYLESTGEGEVRGDKFTMRLSRKNGPEPDATVVRTANLPCLKETYLDGAADLVVEVISLDSEERDSVTKFQLYEQYGVTEYWLINPLVLTAKFFILDENEHYQERQPDEHGIYQSSVLPRLKFPVAVLHERPVAGVRAAVKLVDEMLV